MEDSKLQQVVKEIQEALAKHGLRGQIEVGHVRTRDGFWSAYPDLLDFDDVEHWMDDVAIDYKAWFMAQAKIQESAIPGNSGQISYLVEQVIDDWIEEESGLEDPDDRIDLQYQLAQMTMGQLRQQYPSLYDRLAEAIWDFVRDTDWSDLLDGDLLAEVFGVEAPDDEFSMDALSYWTVYFSTPSGEIDQEKAFRCGLIPFTYKDRTYVALGGAGMDLSPKLDAYQALVVGSIPSDSQFLRQPDYARSVVGDELFEEVMAAIRTSPTIHIHLEEQ